jgi:hypothetical protein
VSKTTAAFADGDRGARESAPAWTAWAFAAATLLGAFLLFQVQPLVGKFILPWFGGATAVWTTCMLFFQIALFGGYAYSHLLVGRLSLRSQVVVHCLLLLAAVAVLPIVPSSAWKPTGDAAPTLVILVLLTATVGLPYFVLSTTSPLIQAWFSRSFPGRMPYRLYALSNLGSFLALLSYPFVFEPALSLATQARLWSWAFLVYVALAALGGIAVWRLRLAQSTLTRSVGEAVTCDPRLRFGLVSGSTVGGIQNACEAPQGSSTATGWLQRALWLLLPACASLVLLATTNHVCQDVAAVPLLWIVPLSLYLLTFIICFDHPRWYVRPLWAGLAVLGIAAVMGSDKMLDWITEPYQHEGMVLTYAHQLCLHFGTMFLICMVCHGELVRLRPAPQRLTEFYLLLSAGGALGGTIAGLVAPQLFKTFLEWNIGMLAAYALATAVLFLAVPRRGMRRSAGLLLCGFAAGGFIPVLLWQGDFRSQASYEPRLVDRQRNFYGVVSVWEYDRDNPELHRFCMKHGAILHGEQFTAPEECRQPFNYYTCESGIGRAIVALQKTNDRLRVGVVGLGVGTLACYARRGDHFTFYEINPAVCEMAEKYFSYLNDARERGATIDLSMGDARLVLERQAPQAFDLLVLDAFSGGSVPVHLLTREAMDIYRRHVAADDVIVIHATNSYLYLFPVVRALAEDARLGWRRVHTTKDSDRFRLASDWVIISRRESLLDAIPNVPPPSTQRDGFAVPVWTDQNNNQFRIMIGSR